MWACRNEKQSQHFLFDAPSGRFGYIAGPKFRWHFQGIALSKGEIGKKLLPLAAMGSEWSELL